MTPTSPTVEDRLRATLIAEADRHPVHPDLDALRTRGEGAIVDLRLPPRRNRARILAAAVVLAVLALGAAAVVQTAGDDGDLPVASGATASGWYLPGPGWEVVTVELVPRVSHDAVRQAIFAPPDAATVPTSRYLEASVYRVDSLDGVTDAWEADGATPVARPADDPPAWLYDASEPVADATVIGLRVLVPGDGTVLVLDGSDVDLDTILAVADRWHETDGREVAPPDDSDLARMGDSSVRDPRPVDGAALARNGIPPRPGPAGLVVVHVRNRDGAETSYSLTGSGVRSLPTGVGDGDRGTARGLEPAARPAPVEDLRGDGEVWTVPAPSTSPQLVGLLPGADVTVDDVGLDGEPAGASEADRRDLMAGLRAVDRDAWATAVEDAVRPVPDWPETLAELRAEMEVVTGTTFAEQAGTASDTTAPDGPEDTQPGPVTTEGEATDDTTTTTTVPGSIDADTVANDLVGFATGAAVVPGARLAPEVTVGFVGSTDADVVLTGDDRNDPERWVLEVDGRWGRVGPTSALELIARAPAALETRSPATPEPTCVGDEPPVEDLVLITPEPEDGGSCLDWFGVVVRVDAEGRIAEVRLALWEP